ncbi:MAG: 2Fe-2S iron-sulfur cluster binding domain-containing protein [Acidobacteria bacterium]|nr:2Fe-2S iron-sulfur cluster binding domain-containing protein [Acidobacteriota bacterium]
MSQRIALTVNGEQVEVEFTGRTLLSVLRDDFGLRSVKDGCSPQGQCGCCTVLVDGQPRVSCVTPVRRVEGRAITTFEGLAADTAAAWGEAFCSAGASQCGFCTPGIVLRLEGLTTKVGKDAVDDANVRRALSAHLCRCTGWQSIVEAAVGFPGQVVDAATASQRAEIEGGTPQRFGPDVVFGKGGFADDSAPNDALVALRGSDGQWAVGENLDDARAAAAKVQGRRTTLATPQPLEVPDGDWVRTLRTSWVDPAYLETDAAWCAPGAEPSNPLANGGSFGGKLDATVGAEARRLADEHGRPVRVLWSREDVARLAPKRPPVAAGLRADGTGVIRVARTKGIATQILAVAPGLEIEEVDVAGPPTSAALRGAGMVEAAVLMASLSPDPRVTLPAGGSASAEVRADGAIAVEVEAGAPLSEVVLRSYCLGAAHMAYSWVTSESLAVDETGEVLDLTVRSFGVVGAAAMPPVEVSIVASDGPSVNGSDAVFAAVAAAVWQDRDYATTWPTG